MNHILRTTKIPQNRHYFIILKFDIDNFFTINNYSKFLIRSWIEGQQYLMKFPCSKKKKVFCAERRVSVRFFRVSVSRNETQSWDACPRRKPLTATSALYIDVLSSVLKRRYVIVTVKPNPICCCYMFCFLSKHKQTWVDGFPFFLTMRLSGNNVS